MALSASKKSILLWLLLPLIGLLALWFLFRRGPAPTINRILSRYGIPSLTRKYWIAISAFETNFWTSRVFRDSNNLFNIIMPAKYGLPALKYGEGQTIFSSTEESVVALAEHVLKPFNYPRVPASLGDLVSYMKTKGFYTASEALYQTGARSAFDKLYG